MLGFFFPSLLRALPSQGIYPQYSSVFEKQRSHRNDMKMRREGAERGEMSREPAVLHQIALILF